MPARTSVGRTIARYETPILLITVLFVLACIAGFSSPVFARVATGGLISVVLVVGLHIFIGNSGILSFAHLSFSGIAAYATAWLTMRPQFKAMMLPGLPEFIQHAQLNPTVAAIAAALAAAAVAAIVGLVLMRLSGIAATIGTLAFLAIFYAVYSNYDSVTGGVGSLAGIPTGLTVWGVLPWAAVAIVIAHLYARSGACLALRSIREDELAARGVGIVRLRVKLIAFVISAFVCGLAGYLQARHLGVVSPDSFYFDATLSALTMLIVGGSYSLTGAVAGVVIITALTELLIRLEGVNQVFGLEIPIPAGTANCALAIVLAVVLVRKPRGILGETEMRITRPFS